MADGRTEGPPTGSSAHTVHYLLERIQSRKIRRGSLGSRTTPAVRLTVEGRAHGTDRVVVARTEPPPRVVGREGSRNDVVPPSGSGRVGGQKDISPEHRDHDTGVATLAAERTRASEVDGPGLAGSLTAQARKPGYPILRNRRRLPTTCTAAGQEASRRQKRALQRRQSPPRPQSWQVR
jgi:hypothetical protein